MLADRLKISVDRAGHRISGVTIEGRSFLTSRYLEGKPPQAVAPVLSRLYALCGWGQSTAAESAVAAAAGEAAKVDALPLRAEAVLESLWRLRIDLPALFGIPPDLTGLADLRRALATAASDAAAWPGLIAALQGALEPGLPDRFPEAAADWDEWLTGPSPLARLLVRFPEFDAPVPAPFSLAPDSLERLAVRLADPAFAERPDLNGAPAETGALARCREKPLIRALLRREGATPRVRFAARLLELSNAPAELWRLLDGGAEERLMGALSPEPGVGIGWAETARGLLIHRAEVAAGRIVRYRIVAPTEWNFHPDGALTMGLLGQPAADDEAARRHAELAVLALDPCVPYTIEVRHA